MLVLALGRLGGLRNGKGVRAADRLQQITAPTLVLAVAELIPGALFEVMEEEAHQPFQEVPDEWNARVDTFWREVETQG